MKETQMKTVIVSGVVLLVGLCQVVMGQAPGNERGKVLAALEQKIVGEWKGQIGCDGKFVFRADGTYDLLEYGPGYYDCAGTWKVRWDALPPTLVLTFKTCEIQELVGSTT
jgi:hypothetical protein